jgi:hypothetical protein
MNAQKLLAMHQDRTWPLCDCMAGHGTEKKLVWQILMPVCLKSGGRVMEIIRYGSPIGMFVEGTDSSIRPQTSFRSKVYLEMLEDRSEAKPMTTELLPVISCRVVELFEEI